MTANWCQSRVSMASLMIRPGSFSQVELGGLEPPTPCLQTTGTTSTGIHSRRSPSPDVRPGPLRSRPVAVLSCCTHRQGPQQLSDVAVPPAASWDSCLHRPVAPFCRGPTCQVACRTSELSAGTSAISAWRGYHAAGRCIPWRWQVRSGAAVTVTWLLILYGAGS